MIGRNFIILCLSSAVAAWAQDVPENPFETPAAKPGQQPEQQVVTSLDTFQFSGIWKMDGKVRISVFDTKEQKGYWLSEGELGALGLSFQMFDDKNKTVVLAQNGVNKKLSLNKVKIEPLKVSPTQNVNKPQMPVATTAKRPTTNGRVESDQEARERIQRVAEEIRRRRAERRKQLQNRNN